MSQNVLEKLFDSPVKLRLLKLFLRNPQMQFSLPEIRKRTLLKTPAIKIQVEKLQDIKFIKRSKRKGERVYLLNQKFTFLKELQGLILKSSPADESNMTRKIKSLGRVKLAVISGVFSKPNREELKTDIFLVGEGISEKKVHSFIKNLEAEVGTELYYTILTTEEFNYRYKMFDRFILDILEKPHKKLINRLIN